MKTGIELITEERQRQVEQEGWTEKHDDSHDASELSRAAACYAAQASAYARVSEEVRLEIYKDTPPASIGWPWGMKWWKPKNPLRDLVRAGALIAAEIDRLQRAQSADVCKVCRTPGCVESNGRDFHKGPRFGSIECDYSMVPPFADAEWANDPDPLCFWCAGSGHPYGDESYGMCECPDMES